jgi:acylphosphatase
VAASIPFGGGASTVSQSDRQQRELYYAGSVQGVGFRYTVRSLARGFEVAGFVRNLSDGRVHLVTEGEAEEVVAFLDAVRAEMGHYISDVEEKVRPAAGRFQGFEIRH